MRRNIVIWAVLLVAVEAVIALGAWWMVHQVESGALATTTPQEAKERIVQACALFGGAVALLIVLLATITTMRRRGGRGDRDVSR